MVIYAEYLFLENFITGLILLYVTREFTIINFRSSGSCHFTKIFKRNSKYCGSIVNSFERKHDVAKKDLENNKRVIKARILKSGGTLRLVTGAIMCGAYSFVLFLNMSWYISFLSKILFSVSVVIISLGADDFFILIKKTIVFIVMTFLMGGITIGLLYLTKSTGIAANTSLYLEGITYINITTGIITTFMVALWINRIMKIKRTTGNLFYETDIFIGENTYNFRGYIDSGNNLKDPINGKPVVILSKRATRKVKAQEKNLNNKIRMIPYSTLGNSKSIMQGYQVDKLIAHRENVDIEIKNPDIAFYDMNFPAIGTVTYDVLLGENMLREKILLRKE